MVGHMPMEPVNENYAHSIDYFCLGGEEQFEPDYDSDDGAIGEPSRERSFQLQPVIQVEKTVVLGSSYSVLTEPAEGLCSASSVADKQTTVAATPAAAATPNNCKKFKLTRPGSVPLVMPPQRSRRSWRLPSKPRGKDNSQERSDSNKATEMCSSGPLETLDGEKPVSEVVLEKTVANDGIILEGEWYVVLIFGVFFDGITLIYMVYVWNGKRTLKQSE
jgi:hypothetical protein